MLTVTVRKWCQTPDIALQLYQVAVDTYVRSSPSQLPGSRRGLAYPPESYSYTHTPVSLTVTLSVSDLGFANLGRQVV